MGYDINVVRGIIRRWVIYGLGCDFGGRRLMRIWIYVFKKGSVSRDKDISMLQII